MIKRNNSVKRSTFAFLLSPFAFSLILLAQTPHRGLLRTPSGDQPMIYVQQAGVTYFSAFDVITALGGAITPDSSGFKVTLGTAVAAFGPDSRFAVVGEDLIEMPVPPITVDGRPFVTHQFFQGLLSKGEAMEAVWDPASQILAIRPLQQTAVSVQMALTHLQGISKIVLTLSEPSEYTIVKEERTYTIRFRNPVQAPFAEQSYDDPNVASATFSRNEVRLDLTSPDVVGDSYRLENPFRIVLDLRKGPATVPGPTPSGPTLKPVEPLGIRTIVIDPGHGGKEVGAVGPRGVMEKDVTLSIARKLAASLAAKLGARVILTREDDSIVSLDQRTAVANQYKADLFLSVHLNAAVVKDAKGSETYFLSLEASDELARRAAETENAASMVSGSDSASDLKLILWDLAQQEYLQESSRFAQVIQEEMNAATGVENRGVKQAPFKVLIGATMPAALVEVGFISNPDEEAKLQTDSFQSVMVEALTRGVQRFKTEYETRVGLVQPPKQPLAGGIKPAAPAQKGRSGT